MHFHSVTPEGNTDLYSIKNDFTVPFMMDRLLPVPYCYLFLTWCKQNAFINAFIYLLVLVKSILFQNQVSLWKLIWIN